MATFKEWKSKRGEAYQIGYADPISGKFKRRVVYCTRKEAAMIVKRIDADIAFGTFSIDRPGGRYKTWKHLHEKYIGYANGEKSSTTVKRDKFVIEAFTAFLKGDSMAVRQITSDVVTDFKHNRLRSVAPASVALEMRHLKTIFNMGVHWKMITVNPFIGVKPPKREDIKVRFLMEEEIERLLVVISDADDIDFYRLVQIYLNTGARRIEVLKQTFGWSNVDFINNKIHILGKGAKTRYIPMNSTVSRIFKEIKLEGKEYPFDYHPDTVSHRIQKYYKTAKIEGATLHSLRKTFGSILIQKGHTDLLTVSRLLGHSSIRTTEEYYVELLDEDYRKSVDGLDALAGFSDFKAADSR